MRRRVFIVDECSDDLFALEQSREYEEWIRAVKQAIDLSGSTETKVISASSEELNQVGKRLNDVLVFLSKRRLLLACKIKKARPHIRVVVFTDFIPQTCSVVFVGKEWQLTTPQIQKIVLG